MTGMKEANGVELEADPKAIDLNKVKAYALAHKLSLQDAYRSLLASDLLKRIDLSTADTQLKIVLRIFVSMVVGEVTLDNAPKKTNF